MPILTGLSCARTANMPSRAVPGFCLRKSLPVFFLLFLHRGRRGAYLLGVTCSKPWMTSSLWEGSGAPGFLLVLRRLTTEHELATRVHQRHCEKGCQVKKILSILLPTLPCSMANTNPRLLILCRDPKHDRQKRAKIVTVGRRQRCGLYEGNHTSFVR